MADGDVLDISEWPLATEPGRPRPRIEIALRPEDGSIWNVVLPAHAIVPYQDDGRTALPFERRPIDLDAAGRHREDW